MFPELGKSTVPPLKTIPPSFEPHQSRRLRSRHLWSIQAHLTIQTTLLGFEYMDQHPGSKYMKRRPAREKPADDNSRLPRSSRIYLNTHVSRARKKYCVAPEDHVSPSCEQCQSRRLQSKHLWSIRTCLRCLTIRRTLLDVEYMDQRPGSKHSAQVLCNPTLVE
ncbi:hypothetical protein IW261DRAFT_1579560 [Armillaria novae-zelandiae]|uniref:Uncharacterized protein n=1 Tax=Armillaria novae-zelandiae TaxID=153914 RepID=A0AA39KD90_9AGAR|nr:hypothetical protein IW261DRAFT_1579560 [Armillaria novae-zelandiae]